MKDENNTIVVDSQPAEVKEAEVESANALVALDTASLQIEAEKILNELVSETDINKAKDLTYLFNLNQNKKTMVRVNKQSELLDLLTDTTINRVKKAPDNLSNDDLAKLMKTIADLMEKGQNQINREDPAPMIQINQQNNEVNVDGKPGFNRDSREKVKNVIMTLLKNAANGDASAVDNILNIDGDQ